uniref:Retrotransposon gag domain-containing protein n=1 Tax=Tanacetum cinerariifolium TaxID=118510 RepID=A0A6L2L3L6_TANCI|nr:hypothetical protein [Tanacetum cinerariifolium]
MHTHSSSNLHVVSPPNPSTSNPKCCNHIRSRQPFILKEFPVDTMADQRTMAELLRAPNEGYAEAIAEDLVSKFINEFFPPSRTTNLRNEISNFQQWFDESFHEAWDIYKDLLRACPHHGFTKLHQLDTFYNALNPADQDSLDSVAGGNLLERRTQDVLTINENKSKQTSDVTTAMTAILKQFQATPPPAFVKAVVEICVTYGGAHPYYQCLAAGGNTFPELRDNIQGYVAAAVVNYNQGNFVYRPPGMANQIRPSEQSYQASTQQNQVVPLNELAKVKRMNKANMKAMQTQINNVKNEFRNEMKNSIQASLSNQTNELKNMMASFFQMKTASTSGSRSLSSNTVANPKGELKAITTRSAIVLDGPSFPIPLPFINPKEDERVEETIINQDLAEYTIKVPPPLLHVNITLADDLILMPKYHKMLKPLLSNKEKLQELANTPLNENCLVVILKKLPEKLGNPGKFLIPCGVSELKYKALTDLGASINLMPLSIWKKLGLPELISTYLSYGARDLIDVYGEEMILRDGDERLTLNMRHDTSSYSNQPQKESINLINEFADELALITFPPEYDDDLQFDIESDLKEIEYMLHHDPIDSSIKESIDQSNLADLNDNLVDSMPEMFTNEHALDYSSPSLFDEYDDDLFKVESDTENVYDDPFDSKGEKTKESKLLIEELDLHCDFLPSSEYDSFICEDFSRVDAFPSTNNEDKVFNPSSFKKTLLKSLLVLFKVRS